MKKPKVILGTVQLGLDYGISNTKGKPSQDQAMSILKLAQENGISSLDTASAYGDSIEVISQYKDRFNIYSKFLGQEDDFFSSFQKQKEQLKHHNIQCLSFHHYNDFLNFKEWPRLDSLRQQENISIGVSVYDNQQALAVISKGHVDLIQMPMNLLDNQNLKSEVIEAAKDQKIALQIRSIFLQGLFFITPEKLPEKLTPLKPQIIHLQQLSKDFNVPLPEMAFRYILSIPHIDSFTFGVDSKEQLQQNLDYIDLGPLPSQIIKAIHEIVITHQELLNPGNW